ncbi:SDR family oxidoreductase [Leifsonia sp. 2TAF2]|uniref:SDR family oxidoreductase n=1 Tax=Leifsonia sp. 2TAF2 TaxID=3233009 RepID=UPI003F9802C6
MKIVVAGGTGLVGAAVVDKLRAAGHDAVAASRRTGVNLYTADGLADALEGAQVVVDASNSRYTDYPGALDFFETATLNLLTLGAAAGVRHHVVLSVVGSEKLASSGGLYFQAKAEQERLVAESGMPYSIVHSTQFFEFVRAIADSASDAHVARVAEALVQPIAAEDAASAVVETATGAPTQRVVEVAGPDQFRLGDLVELELRWAHDPREVRADTEGEYFGARLGAHDLLPSPDATLYWSHFTDWLDRRT